MCSNQSRRIIDWLSSCEGDDGSKAEIEHPPQSTKKRKLDMNDATPVAKRQAIGIATPSLSRGSPERRNLFETAPSFHSSTATSRSSSPGKRQRSSEIEFSNPSVEFYSAFSLPPIRDEAEIPSWTELMNAIAIKEDSMFLAQTALVEHELDKICKNIGYCEQRDGNEDAWCELVVHPILLLAARLSRNSRYVDVLNVYVPMATLLEYANTPAVRALTYIPATSYLRSNAVLRSPQNASITLSGSNLPLTMPGKRQSGAYKIALSTNPRTR